MLKSDGYAGLTVAKVAARAGENKALISYHFGSKQGVVAAAAAQLGEMITADVLDGIRGTRTVEEVIRGATEGIWRVLERDVRLPRAYFDLNAVSVVDDDVRAALREVKSRWRDVLAGLLREAGVPEQRVASGTVLIIGSLEGFSLEWIERGDTPELNAARELFIRTATAALAESLA